MESGVSVIICTHNGVKLLPDTIRHLAAQQVSSGIAWEVLVIDNASTDSSAEVVKDEWAKYKNPAPLIILSQPKKGLTFAREMGLNQSQHGLIIFCDDDNWLAPDYIETAYNLMIANPSIGILGGNGELVFEKPPPAWAKNFKAFASGPQASTSGKVKYNAVYGAGCVIRKTAYNKLTKAGFTPLLSDRTASNLSSGGDYELCYAIALAGYDIWYDEELRFKHYMPEKRINVDYCTRLFKEGSKSLSILIPYRIRVNMRAKSNTSFNLFILKTFYYYLKKSLPLLLRHALSKSSSEKAIMTKIQLTSVKYKIFSFRNYRTMKQNFSKVLQLETELTKYRYYKNT
jgi:glycosyltransferase involved in cell wall biosynthesis